MIKKQIDRWNLLVRDCADSYYNHINVGGKFTRSVIVAVNEELKQKDKDLHEFAEWCSDWGWIWIRSEERWERLCGVSAKFEDINEYKTTSQLREIWEVETGRREKL